MDGSDLSHTESESLACGPTDHYHLQADLLERRKKNKKIGWLVGCFDMDASPEFCFPPSIDARAVFFSFVGLGFVTPISPFFVCVIGWIWCFFVYLTSTCSLLVLSPPSLFMMIV